MNAMLTRRRDQVPNRRRYARLAKRCERACGRLPWDRGSAVAIRWAGWLSRQPNDIIGGILFCGSAGGRDGWIRRLHVAGYNHFVCFVDVNSPWALQFSRGSGPLYVLR